jgi:drug/metabolite transporter (DMT)-like permease
MSQSMLLGTTYIMFGNFLWGLAFVVPTLLPNYSAIEITFGRYFVYGIISLGLCLVRNDINLGAIDAKLWGKALLFAFCGNIGYYFFLVLAIQLMGAPIPTLIVGILPVTLALYGNWLNRELKFYKLIPSIVMILLGTIVVNIISICGTLEGDGSNWSFSGLGFSLIALGLWTWYGVANTHFLKTHPQFSANTWATITGVATVILLPFLFAAIEYINPQAMDYMKLSQIPDSYLFWLINIILGFMVSWGGAVLWNKASLLLPIFLASQLMVGETIVGLGFVYILNKAFPSLFESVGIIMIIAGVIYSIQTTSNREGDHYYESIEHGK